MNIGILSIILLVVLMMQAVSELIECREEVERSELFSRRLLFLCNLELNKYCSLTKNDCGVLYTRKHPAEFAYRQMSLTY